MKVTQIITESPIRLIINLNLSATSSHPGSQFNKFDMKLGYKIKITNPKDPIK